MISVIVPVYNVKEYLGRCIESILGQSFGDIEVILVDDGSTDGSGEICDSYALRDGRVRVIHKTNGGVSAARNTAIDVVQGEYMFFADSDDYLKKDCLETLHNAILENSCDCVSMNYCLVDDKENVEEVKHPLCSAVLTNDAQRLSYIINSVLKETSIRALWSKLFKTEIIKKHDIKICETCENFAEDMGFYLVYLMKCKKIVMLDYAGYYYYQRSGSMMDKTKTDIKLNALNEVSAYLYDYLYRFDVENDLLKMYPRIHFLIMYPQFYRFWKFNCFDRFSEEYDKVNNKKWFKKMMLKTLLHSQKTLSDFSDDRKMLFEYKNFCFYTLHKSYKLFSLLNTLYYKRCSLCL